MHQKIVLALLALIALEAGLLLFGHLPARAQGATSQSASVAASNGRSAHVPIFVYHLVRPAKTTDTPQIRQFLVTSDIFEQEMQYLSDNGYHVISFADLESYLKGGPALPSRSVILSFDDGWENQFTYALPVLEKYHLTATFFIFTNAIGHREFMTWDEVTTLEHAGMTIGDHSRSHPFLALITDQAKLEDEIIGSKRIIEEHIGTTTNEFAYPFSSHNSTTVAMVQKAGYTSARTFSLGVVHTENDLYTLSAVRAPDDLSTFVTYLPH